MSIQGVHLIAGLMDGFDWRARQLQLPARLKTDVRTLFFQPDKLATLFDRRPAVTVTQPFQHHPD